MGRSGSRASSSAKPATRTVLGGGFVNTELRDLSEPRVFDFFDYVTLDDGELPLLRIVKRLARERPKAHGWSARSCERNRVVSGTMPRAKDIPSRAATGARYDGLPLNRYIPLMETLNPMHAPVVRQALEQADAGPWLLLAKCGFCDTALPYIARYDPAPAPGLVECIEDHGRPDRTDGVSFRRRGRAARLATRPGRPC